MSTARLSSPMVTALRRLARSPNGAAPCGAVRLRSNTLAALSARGLVTTWVSNTGSRPLDTVNDVRWAAVTDAGIARLPARRATRR